MTQKTIPYLSAHPPETLSQRFATSFSDFAARTDYTAILRPTELEISTTARAACDGRPFGTDVRDFLEAATRGLVKQAAVGSIRSIICGLATHCESVPELMTCLAVGIVARAKDCAVLYDFGGGCAYGDADGDLILRIQPQARFEQYRVDALVSMLYVQGQEENFQSFSARVVLECDGFEFHERTREQAEHDRVRDRFLQTLGLNVFHFLGAEIWRDSFKCAEDVVLFLYDSIRRQTKFPGRKAPRSIVHSERDRPQSHVNGRE